MASVAFGTDQKNWRWNPFTGTYDLAAIVNEAHRVPLGAYYWVRLVECPDEDTGVSIDYWNAAWIPMTETTGNPGAAEFRVDYKYRTGLVEFNLTRAGDGIRVSYSGTGSPNASASAYRNNDPAATPPPGEDFDLNFVNLIGTADGLDFTQGGDSGAINTAKDPSLAKFTAGGGGTFQTLYDEVANFFIGGSGTPSAINEEQYSHLPRILWATEKPIITSNSSNAARRTGIFLWATTAAATYDAQWYFHDTSDLPELTMRVRDGEICQVHKGSPLEADDLPFELWDERDVARKLSFDEMSPLIDRWRKRDGVGVLDDRALSAWLRRADMTEDVFKNFDFDPAKDRLIPKR